MVNIKPLVRLPCLYFFDIIFILFIFTTWITNHIRLLMKSYENVHAGMQGKYSVLISLCVIACNFFATTVNAQTEIIEITVQPNDTISSLLIRSYVAPSKSAIKAVMLENNLQSSILPVGRQIFISLPIAHSQTQYSNKQSMPNGESTTLVQLNNSVKSVKIEQLSDTDFIFTNVSPLQNPRKLQQHSAVQKKKELKLTYHQSLQDARVTRPELARLTALNTEPEGIKAGEYFRSDLFFINFTPSKYIDSNLGSKNNIAMSREFSLGEGKFGFSSIHGFDSILSGTKETTERTADFSSDLFYRYILDTGNFLNGFDLHSLVERYYGDSHLSHALALAVPVTIGAYWAQLTVQSSDRSWNILEDYTYTTDTEKNSYKTNGSLVDFYFSDYLGVSASTESGKNNGSNFEINTFTFWIYPNDSLYVSLSKSNQRDYYDWTATAEYKSNKNQSADLLVEIGTASKAITTTYTYNDLFSYEIDFQLRGYVENSDQSYKEFAVTITKQY